MRHNRDNTLMNVQIDAKAHVKSIRHLVIRNKSRWKDMDQENVASHTYLRRFSKGEFQNPGIVTLENIQKYLS